MTNKIWILRPREDLTRGDNPWNPWYDKAFGYVVVAPSEKSARDYASEETDDMEKAWLDPAYSTCVEVDTGREGIVLEDFRAA